MVEEMKAYVLDIDFDRAKVWVVETEVYSTLEDALKAAHRVAKEWGGLEVAIAKKLQL